MLNLQLKYLKYLLILFVFQLLSCSNDKGGEIIKSTFDSPFPKRNKDLTNVLGEELIIKNGSDTINLKISSTKKFNLITNKKTKDTIFYGMVCKFRGLYYFNQKLNDTAYWIYAVKIDDNLIYGINSCISQTLSIDKEMESGNYPKLLKYINADTTAIRLHPDKKELKKLFTFIIDKIRPDTILRIQKIEHSPTESTTIIPELDSTNFEIISKVYPNPTKDFLNIELQQKENTEYQVVSINGTLVCKGHFSDVNNKIDLSGKPNGMYLLTLINPIDKQMETVRIVKAN